MRFAGVAYQQFLLAVTINDNDLSHTYQLADQYVNTLFAELMTAVQTTEESSSVLKNSIELQKKIREFSKGFECFCLDTFQHFKQHQAALIVDDPAAAFDQWTRVFDTQYLKYMQQDQVCRDYANILSSTARLFAVFAQHR
ncbi:MAG: hypothetical protein CSB47_05600 [Proteobacteria bacterium]|nr:MAG: hypothetical protein CSB47_05600 [Pseudomonadota bacterium]